jgi:hypothetical protein
MNPAFAFADELSAPAPCKERQERAPRVCFVSLKSQVGYTSNLIGATRRKRGVLNCWLSGRPLLKKREKWRTPSYFVSMF